MLRQRPRPVKQQQEYITKKLFCCKTHVCYPKITVQKNIKKVMTRNAASYGWYCFCIVHKNTDAYYISALSCHTPSCQAHYSVGSKTKSKDLTKTKTEAGLRPVLS